MSTLLDAKKDRYDDLPGITEPPDIWDYYLRFEGGEVPCESLQRFLLLLWSPSTRKIEAAETNTMRGEALVYIEGPMCQDFGPLYARYRLTRGDFAGMSVEEKKALGRRVYALLGERAKSSLLFPALSIPKEPPKPPK